MSSRNAWQRFAGHGARVRSKPDRDRMNRLEADYARHLTDRLYLGEVLWFEYQAVKLRLAPRTWYEPDFLVLAMRDGAPSLEVHETKGFWEEDARIKIKVAAELYPLAVRAGVELAVETAPAAARADPADVEIMLANLVENAIAHAGAGALCRIRCAAAGPGSGDEALLVVEDSGPGIPPELRDAVFARFRRGPRPGAPYFSLRRRSTTGGTTSLTRPPSWKTSFTRRDETYE